MKARDPRDFAQNSGMWIFSQRALTFLGYAYLCYCFSSLFHRVSPNNLLELPLQVRVCGLYLFYPATHLGDGTTN